MGPEKKWLVLMACSVLCANSARAIGDSSGTPYQGIVDRNVFGLKPPPPPPSPESQAPPPPKITITGITTILGNKRVLLKAAVAAKPPEPAKEQSYILAEGQRDGDIEVLQIDEKTGDVKLSNSGQVVMLNLDKDGPKLANTPPAGAPGAPGMPVPGLPGGGVSHPAAAAAGGFQPSAGANLGKGSIPTRSLRTTPAGGGMATPGGIPAPNAFAPGYVSPGTTTYPGVPTSTPNTATSQLRPEEQAILMELERERLKSSGNAGIDIIPPTPLSTPDASTATPGGIPTPGTYNPRTSPNIPLPNLPIPGRPPVPQ